MNERIQELAEQAHVYAGGHSLWCHAGDVEKFAQLIVRECVNVAKQTDSYDDDVYKSGRTWAGIDILKHFGVES